MTTATTDQAALTGTWNLDPVHSNASFAVRHLGITWLRGRLDGFTATITQDADGSLALSGEMPVSGVSIGDDQLLAHLASPDFFDAERHPTLRFSSSDLSIGEDGTLSIRGELAMRGQSHPIEATGTLQGPITDLYGGDRIGLELEAVIDRTQWGISWAADLPDGTAVVGRKVRLGAAIQLTRS